MPARRSLNEGGSPTAESMTHDAPEGAAPWLKNVSPKVCFRIVGRVSDLINVAGKKVNPAEVEAHLLAFAGVRGAVVFGRKSSLRNEEVAACVVADAGIAEAELLKYCRERLSGWQVPKRIFVVEEIPTNERGKTSRRELAARFALG